MKLLIYLAVWKRPEITEICFMGINRLRESFNIDALAVISEDEMKPLCDKYNVKYCFYKNHPLGEKKNYGLSQALNLDWDYVIEIGSDDLIKDELLKLYTPLFGKYHLLGASELVFLNSKTGECRKFKSFIHGAARAISREMVEKFLPLWSDSLNRGLDRNSHFRLVIGGVPDKRVKGSHPLVIDIKSEVNIWKFMRIGEKYSLSETLRGLSGEEINAIRNVAA